MVKPFVGMIVKFQDVKKRYQVDFSCNQRCDLRKSSHLDTISVVGVNSCKIQNSPTTILEQPKMS